MNSQIVIFGCENKVCYSDKQTETVLASMVIVMTSKGGQFDRISEEKPKLFYVEFINF